jgi:hypothetical protein
MNLFSLKLKLAKNRGRYFAGLVLLLLGSSGCANFQKDLVLDPVGPPPAHPIAAVSTNGSLVVYSAGAAVPDLSAEISGNPSDDWEYSGYRILSPDGKLFKFVPNNAGTVQLHPQKIELPAGRYVVVARANGYGRVSVPVLIAGNRITTLHLDAGGFSPVEPGFNQTNTVHLPDGSVVGWRAFAEIAANK